MRINKWAAAAAALGVAALIVGYAAWSRGYLAWGEKDDADEGTSAQLIQRLQGGTVPLEAGIAASQREGTPISGKFEVEDGKLQLSVYTQKGQAFEEVVLDPKTGTIAEVHLITEGEDLTAARSQADAMAKANRTLLAVVEDAVRTHPGARAVSAYPGMKDGHPTVAVT